MYSVYLERVMKEKMRQIILIFELFAAVYAALDNAANVILRDLGEKEYRAIKAKSKFPVHGACWHNALKVLKVNCDKLNDNQHSLLALRLANCFLEDSGHATYECHSIESSSTSAIGRRRECINSMSDRAFGVYNEFYTHATHICFFLNHEMWQAETENNIERLYEASSTMREQLLEATKMQNIVLASQKEGLRIQNELLDHGKELGSVIRSSAETVSGMVVDFQESAKDQRELLYEIFSYLRTFQNWVLAEVSWFQSILYYTIACIVCALFSSSKRTAEARIVLFSILSLNVVAERMLVQYGNSANYSTPDKIELVRISWCFRKLALGLCSATLVYAYFSYSDRGMENYKVLKRIENRLDNLRISESRSKPPRYSRRLAFATSGQAAIPRRENNESDRRVVS